MSQVVDWNRCKDGLVDGDPEVSRIASDEIAPIPSKNVRVPLDIMRRIVLAPAAEGSGGVNSPPRTGSSKVETKVRAPNYVIAYKESIREEFEYLKSQKLITEDKLDKEAIAEIDRKLKEPNGTTLGDLYFIERTILRLQPDDVVRRRAWMIRDKYRVVIGEPAYGEYQKSNPPSEAPDKPIGPLREDLDRILTEFHWRYQTTPLREAERNRISFRIALFMLAAILIVLGAMYYDYSTKLQTGLSTVLMVLLMGAMGACLSLQHRIQSLPASGDAILNILSLRNGWVSIFLAPISGAVFAFVLFLTFSAGLLQGTLFPEVVSTKTETPTANARVVELTRRKEAADTAAVAARTVADQAPTDAPAQAKSVETEAEAEKATVALNAAEARGLSFLEFLKKSIPKTVSDLAKLLLWCFIAGFAERLIPDTLDRLIVRKIAVMEPESASNKNTQLPANPIPTPDGKDKPHSQQGGGGGQGSG